MIRLLVTGGAGFIGSNFVLSMLERRPDAEIVVIDSLTYAGNLENLKSVESHPRFSFQRIDITNDAALRRLFETHDFSHVAHFAAESHVDRSIADPGAFIQTNVIGTFRLLEAALRAWDGRLDQKRFLHVSTDEVFGSLGAEGFFTEQSPYQPNSPYAASKAASDHFARAYFHTFGLPVITSNCSNNYGPYQFPEKLIPLVIVNCLQRKPIPVYGDGANVRDWLFVLDHCLALEACLFKGQPGETYAIGARNEVRNIDLVRKLCRIVDQLAPHPEPCENLITFVKDRPGHDRRYAINPERMETELGWKPAYSFDESLASTVQWYISNADWRNRILSGDYLKYYERQYSNR